MITLVLITFGVIIFAAVVGAIPGAVITKAISGTSTNRGPVALGLSVGIGFAFPQLLHHGHSVFSGPTATSF